MGLRQRGFIKSQREKGITEVTPSVSSNRVHAFSTTPRKPASLLGLHVHRGPSRDSGLKNAIKGGLIGGFPY